MRSPPNTESGIAAITNFTKEGYTVDKISYETGTYKGWDSFVVDHHSATEEEYLDVSHCSCFQLEF